MFNNGYFRVEKDSVIRVELDNYIDYSFGLNETVVLEINFSEGIFFLNGIARTFKGSIPTKDELKYSTSPSNYFVEYVPFQDNSFILNSFKASETNFNWALESREYPGEDSVDFDGNIPYPVFQKGKSNSKIYSENGISFEKDNEYINYFYLNGRIGAVGLTKLEYSDYTTWIDYFEFEENKMQFIKTDSFQFNEAGWLKPMHVNFKGNKFQPKLLTRDRIIHLENKGWSLSKINRHYCYYHLDPIPEITGCDTIFNLPFAKNLIIAKKRNNLGYKVWFPEWHYLKDYLSEDAKKIEVRNYFSKGDENRSNYAFVSLDDTIHYLISATTKEPNKSYAQKIDTNDPSTGIPFNHYPLEKEPNYTLILD